MPPSDATNLAVQCDACQRGRRLCCLSAVWGAIILLCLSVSAQAQPSVASRPLIAPPPVLTGTGSIPAPPTAGPHPALTVYSIGDPTDEEQYWLELLNDERANPQAEAQILANTTDPNILANYNYFSVDLSTMVSAFASIPAAPPLSMNAELLAAARGHSQDMLANTYQGHTGSDGSTPPQRIAAQGYDAAADGENVYAYANSVFEGNAAFEVDWGGNPPSGMQSPPGHRDNDHDGVYAEVGIGITDGIADSSGTEYGPILCTMDFGIQQSFTPFVTGVVYYDINGNGAYDMGEGLGGVGVSVSGASFSASTANSGGYSVPTSGAGSQTVTFSVSGLPDQQVATTLTGTSNVEVDLKLTYTPPVVSGTVNPPINQTSSYQFTPLPGASAYQFMQARLIPFDTVETGQNGASDFSVVTTSTYSVVASDEPYNGGPSFHLAHLTTDEQSMTLNFTLVPSASSALKFESLLGYATNTEVAAAQVSADGGTTWQNVWSEAGTNGSGDSSFSGQSVSLSQFAGEQIMIRFVYDSTGSSYYNSSATGVGFYFDNLQVTNAGEITNPVVTNIPSGTSFDFDPTVTGTYELAVRAQAVNRYFPYGPDDTVVAVSGTTVAGGTPPAATTDAASSVGTTTATLNGSVNPEGSATSAFFQWGPSSTYKYTTNAVSLGNGSSTLMTSASLSSLVAAASYHFRVVATSVSGTAYGVDEMFETSSVPGGSPLVTTQAASNVTAATATLNGTVNPDGFDTSIFFEYGLSTTYTNHSGTIDAGSLSEVLSATCDLTSLLPLTTYHFRLVGSNAKGTVDGGDQVFTTGTGIPLMNFKATYAGLIGSNPPANALSGIVAVTLSGNGSYTARGKLGGKAISFSGRLNADGTSFASLPGGLRAQLQLVTQPAAMILGGIASSSTSTSIALNPVSKSLSAREFTFRMPTGAGLPAGDGYGTIKLAAKSSAATFAGKLGDGTKIAFGGNVVLDGSNDLPTIPVYIPLYGGKGSIAGLLTIETTVHGDLDGAMTWFTPASPAVQANLFGSIYVKPPSGQRVIDLPMGTLTFTGGGLASPLQNTVALATDNKLMVTGTSSDTLKMSVKVSNGLFSGSFLAPGGKKPTPFAGALFQGTLNFGIGLFDSADGPGSVEFQ